MNPTTDILAALDEIDALAAKATKGHWVKGKQDFGVARHLPSTAVVINSGGTAIADLCGRKELRVAVEALETCVRDIDSWSQILEKEWPNFDGQLYGARNDAHKAITSIRALLKGEKP